MPTLQKQDIVISFTGKNTVKHKGAQLNPNLSKVLHELWSMCYEILILYYISIVIINNLCQ